jgi:hypothetical protein
MPQAIRFGKAAASLLESILLGKSLKKSMEKLMEQAMSSVSNFSIDDADIGDACLCALMEAKMKDTALQLMEETLAPDEDQGGRSGKYPAAFVLPMFLFYKTIGEYGDNITEEAFVKAIRANIMAGGDTCSRAILLGAVLAGAAGEVPESFMEKFMPKETLEQVNEAIQEIQQSVG